MPAGILLNPHHHTQFFSANAPRRSESKFWSCGPTCAGQPFRTSSTTPEITRLSAVVAVYGRRLRPAPGIPRRLNCRPILHRTGAETQSKVGRVPHVRDYAPGTGQAHFGLNLVFPRSYERGYGARPSGAKLHVCQIPYDTGGARLCSRAKRKRCWSTALQKLLLQSFTADA